jgi:hypothetical protein
VDAVYVIEVPPQLSLESGMEAEEARAVALLDAARIRARESKLKVRTSVIRTRNPGAALVDEARSRGSEIVYFDMAHAPPAERVFGPITSTLLRERPCRIVIETESNGRRNGHQSNGASAPREPARSPEGFPSLPAPGPGRTAAGGTAVRSRMSSPWRSRG